MKIRNVLLASLLVGLGSYAGDIIVSWESNGVLVATGMEPGTAYTVEWASDLQDGFTNNPAPFEGLVADSNGVGRVAIPMFFRVGSTPKRMVAIPAGTNSGTDPDFGIYSLTNAAEFHMDRTEVTKAQWDTVYNWALANGYQFDNPGLGKAFNHPVHSVNWYDCVKWCNARSQMEGKTPCYNLSTWSCDFNANGYRLPTISEWEYAARGGLSGKRFPWGDAINHGYANYSANGSAYSYDTSPYTSYTFHPSYDEGGYPYTSPAGSFSSNGHGLHDMSGNVREWCGTAPGSLHCFRGGSYSSFAYAARCGLKSWGNPGGESAGIGLRAVRR